MMHLRRIKFYRSSKYFNRSFTKHFRNDIRAGDSVKVLVGDHKGFVGKVIRSFAKYVYIENLFSQSLCDKRFMNKSSKERPLVNKYFKISINNVRHVDEDSKIIKTKRLSITKENNKLSKGNLVNDKGVVIDNFVSKVLEKRALREKQRLEEESKKKIDTSSKEDLEVEREENFVNNEDNDIKNNTNSEEKTIDSETNSRDVNKDTTNEDLKE